MFRLSEKKMSLKSFCECSFLKKEMEKINESFSVIQKELHLKNYVDGKASFEKKDVDYLSNICPRSFPDGLDVEIFKIKALATTCVRAKTKYDREHVTKYMLKSKKFKKYNYKLTENYSKLRITLDYKKDLTIIRNTIKKLKYKTNFTWKEIVKVLNA